jgi:hypothetical protein
MSPNVVVRHNRLEDADTAIALVARLRRIERNISVLPARLCALKPPFWHPFAMSLAKMMS